MTDPQPQPLDLASWPRREHFEHYRDRSPCTYSATVELDVTELRGALRATGSKTYAAHIWALATSVNRHPEFRTTVDDQGRPAVWPLLHPRFTVFNPDRETFAAVWAPYSPDFRTFHDRVVELLQEFRHATAMFPQADAPENVFDVSSLPWMGFTGFTLNIAAGHHHYLPIFTLGQQHEREDRTVIPLAIQIHHAVADGYHVARFVNGLQEDLGDPTWVS